MPNFILASSSPRRIEMLKPYFPDMLVTSSASEVPADRAGDPVIEAISCALSKLKDITLKYSHGVVLAADTLVWLDEVIGKPHDKEDARAMIQKLSGRTHQVITGLAFQDCDKGRLYVDYERSLVRFRSISEGELEDYLNQAHYMDKAGAYALQEEAAAFVVEVQGDPNNVIGLPLEKVLHLLEVHYEIQHRSSCIGSQ